MGELMRAKDWAATPLGCAASWPQSLCTSVSICLGTSFPMMIAWGPELCMLYNDGYLPVLGTHKHPRALGQPLLECFPELCGLIGPMFHGVMASGQPVGAEDMMFPLERNGYPEETYFVFSYSPIRDESGNVGGVLTTCTETTHRVLGERRLGTLRRLADRAAHAKTAEEALCEAARTFDPAEFPFALLYLVEDGGHAARLVARSGLPAGSAAARPSIELGCLASAPWPLDPAAGAGSQLVVGDLRSRFGDLPGGPWPEPTTEAVVLPVTRPGLPHPYAFLIAGVSPRRPLDDAYRSYFGLVADQLATALCNARAHEEQRRRAEALAELDRAKTAFFGNVSHEFRTPLTLLLGPLEELLGGARGALPDGVRSELEIVQRNGQRLLKLVNTLLDFARIEAGRADAAYEPVALGAATEELAGVFRSTVERAGLRFVVDCPPLPAPAYVDPEMWEKIVLNLLSNAFKFTFEGEIAVRLRQRDERIVLEVQDTGTGIAAEELPHLFERFHRVQGARARSHEGTGIGLALVRDLLELHGGGITVDSGPGRGSTFRAWIRAGSAHLPRERVHAARTRPSTAVRADTFVQEARRWIPSAPAEVAAGEAADVRSVASSVLSTMGARVLIVDDNADMRDYLRRILGQHWTIQSAVDGGSALEQALENPPELVLTDVMMPRLDGFMLLRSLRSDPRTRRVPVIMLSARAGEEARIEGLDAGADDYLTKPFSARELVARVASQLVLARGRRALDEQRAALYARFLRAPAPICVLRGPEHLIELANPACCELWQRERDQVAGRPLFDVLPELAANGLDALLAEIAQNGRAYVGREPLAAPERVRGFEFMYAPLKDAHGRAQGVLVVGIDPNARAPRA